MTHLFASPGMSTISYVVLLIEALSIVFLILCIDDPVTVVLFFRKEQYGGMGRRDWIIFLLATLVANLYWIVGWTLATALLWAKIKGLFSP